MFDISTKELKDSGPEMHTTSKVNIILH